MTIHDQLISEFDELLLFAISVTCRAYQMNVENMYKEKLHQEFCNVIGDECGDFTWLWEHKGREAIENMLCDKFEVRKFKEYINK